VTRAASCWPRSRRAARPVKKKWAKGGGARGAAAGRSPPPPAPPPPPGRRTVRHMRLRLEGDTLTLRYYRRGVAGALARGRAEVVAVVRRVAAPPAAWLPGAAFLLTHPTAAVLALEPPDAAAAAGVGVGAQRRPRRRRAAAARRAAGLRARAVPRAAAYAVAGEGGGA